MTIQKYFFQICLDIQLFGHFMSTYVGVDEECLFFGSTFFYFGTQYFGIFENVSFRSLGISCLLIFEWLQNYFSLGPTFFCFCDIQ